MLKVGLTGGIGCGKSTAVDAFCAFGVPIIDADKISKEMVAKGSEALTEVTEAFGDDFVQENGELNRPLLRQKIFAEPKVLSQLEAILHPRIKLEIERQILELEEAEHDYVIVDVPLLVELNYQAMFDRIVVIDCMPEQQIQRVTLRDELNQTDIKKIIGKQASRKQRNKAANYIIDNTKDRKSLSSQINHLHKTLVALPL